jgi:DNA-binding CsgD family transcriptional regulator
MIISLNDLLLQDTANIPLLQNQPLFAGECYAGIFMPGDYFIYLFDPQKLEYIWLSDTVELFCGCRKDDVTSRMMFDSTHPDDVNSLAKYETEIHDFFAGDVLNRQGYKVLYSFRFRKSDGKYIQVLRQMFFFVSKENPGYYYRVGIMSDITGLSGSNPDSYIKIVNIHSGKAFSEKLDNTIKVIPCPLSKREKEIVYYVNLGMSSKAIAEKLFMSYETVKTHRKNIYKKLDCKTDVQLIKACLYHQWTDLIYR